MGYMGADLITSFHPADLVALALLLACWLGLGLWIEAPGIAKPSVSVLMAAYRREWMRQFVTRQPRMYDASIMANLRQSTSFLASATMIALGGLLAVIGNADRLAGVAQDLSLVSTEARGIEARLLLAALLLTHAFLKFLWSNRLFGYCAILMSAVPNDPADPLALPRARQSAEINIRAAFNFNRGLRSMYFALAALTWLLGPFALMAATLAMAWLIWSREFASHSRAILLDPAPAKD